MPDSRAEVEELFRRSPSPREVAREWLDGHKHDAQAGQMRAARLLKETRVALDYASDLLAEFEAEFARLMKEKDRG